jgi:hypothetical protein
VAAVGDHAPGIAEPSPAPQPLCPRWDRDPADDQPPRRFQGQVSWNEILRPRGSPHRNSTLARSTYRSVEASYVDFWRDDNEARRPPCHDGLPSRGAKGLLGEVKASRRPWGRASADAPAPRPAEASTSRQVAGRQSLSQDSGPLPRKDSPATICATYPIIFPASRSVARMSSGTAGGSRPTA